MTKNEIAWDDDAAVRHVLRNVVETILGVDLETYQGYTRGIGKTLDIQILDARAAQAREKLDQFAKVPYHVSFTDGAPVKIGDVAVNEDYRSDGSPSAVARISYNEEGWILSDEDLRFIQSGRRDQTARKATAATADGTLIESGLVVYAAKDSQLRPYVKYRVSNVWYPQPGTSDPIKAAVWEEKEDGSESSARLVVQPQELSSSPLNPLLGADKKPIFEGDVVWRKGVPGVQTVEEITDEGRIRLSGCDYSVDAPLYLTHEDQGADSLERIAKDREQDPYDYLQVRRYVNPAEQDEDLRIEQLEDLLNRASLLR